MSPLASNALSSPCSYQGSSRSLASSGLSTTGPFHRISVMLIAQPMLERRQQINKDSRKDLLSTVKRRDHIDAGAPARLSTDQAAGLDVLRSSTRLKLVCPAKPVLVSWNLDDRTSAFGSSD